MRKKLFSVALSTTLVLGLTPLPSYAATEQPGSAEAAATQAVENAIQNEDATAEAQAEEASATNTQPEAPTAIEADPAKEPEPSVLTATASEETATVEASATSGKWGKNLTWEYDPVTFTLTISGEGALEGSTSSKSSFATYVNRRTEHLVINPGVTSIGEGSFSDLKALQTVSLPSTITELGVAAFYNCTSIKSVYVPSIKSFLSYSFGDNSSFGNASGNPLLYGADLYANGEKVVDLIIPDDIEKISDCAFYGCGSLASVTLPSSMKNVGAFAFCNCKSLESVTLSSSRVNFASKAFSECTSLKSVYVPSVESFLSHGFSDPSANPLCNGADLYVNGEKAVDLVIPDGIQSIPSFAFAGCESLASVTLPSSRINFASKAFSECTSLKSVYVPSVESFLSHRFSDPSANPLCNGADLYVNGEKAVDLVVPDGVEAIPDYAFRNCSSLASITLSSSVRTVGKSAFYNCTSLKSATLSSSVETLNESTFYGCTSLESVTLPSSAKTIGKSAFESCTSLGSVTLPSSVTTVNEKAFYGCSSLESVDLLSSNTTFERWAFMRCSSLKSVYAANVESFLSHSFSSFFANPLCNGADLYIDGEEAVDLAIPDGIETIPDHAFDGCSSLKSVTAAPSLKTVNEYAFYRCSSLEKANLPATVATIQNCAFEDCTSLRVFRVPAGITNIFSNVFKGCSSLTKVSIPVATTWISSSAFHGCDKLTDVYYGGTQEQRNSISGESDRPALENATWHYDQYTYTITKGDCPGGKITVLNNTDGTKGTLYPKAGATVRFRTTPEAGYTLTRMSYTRATDGKTVPLKRVEGTGQPGSSSVYEFQMPDCDVTLNAEFGYLGNRDISKNIVGSDDCRLMLCGPDGKVSSTATMHPFVGATVYFRAIPEAGRKLSKCNYSYTDASGKTVTLALKSLGGGLYSFTMPNRDVTLNGVFVRK